MVSINPDPHASGYKFSPTYHVTAIFDNVNSLPAVLEDLREAGIEEEDVEVYVGDEGAQRLDNRGKRHGVIVRALHDLVMLLSDETAIQAKFVKAIQAGGHVVSIDTDGDAAKKSIAMATLATSGGKDVSYWGAMAVEGQADEPTQ